MVSTAAATHRYLAYGRLRLCGLHCLDSRALEQALRGNRALGLLAVVLNNRKRSGWSLTIEGGGAADSRAREGCESLSEHDCGREVAMGW